MDNTTTTQLDQAEQAIIGRLQARIDNPKFSQDQTYLLAMQHAIDIVRLESDIVRDKW